MKNINAVSTPGEIVKNYYKDEYLKLCIFYKISEKCYDFLNNFP